MANVDARNEMADVDARFRCGSADGTAGPAPGPSRQHSTTSRSETSRPPRPASRLPILWGVPSRALGCPALPRDRRPSDRPPLRRSSPACPSRLAPGPVSEGPAGPAEPSRPRGRKRTTGRPGPGRGRIVPNREQSERRAGRTGPRPDRLAPGSGSERRAGRAEPLPDRPEPGAGSERRAGPARSPSIVPKRADRRRS